jgi:four helix bundle protein
MRRWCIPFLLGLWMIDNRLWTGVASASYRHEDANVSRDYKKIIAWQKAHTLTLTVYHITKAFPADERFGITSQLRRASYSVAPNIAEGSGRDSNRDYLRFLYIAFGSLRETEYFLLLARDLAFLSDEEHNTATEQVNSAFAVLDGLIKAVKKEVGPLGRVIALFLSSTVLRLGRIATVS